MTLAVRWSPQQHAKMTAFPDYTAQGYKEIIVTLEGSILTILINRAK